MFVRRLLIAAALLCVAAVPRAQAPAATPTTAWPAHAVHIVVPSPAGGGIDLVARLLAMRLAKRWGESVVVDNKPGANSIIGTEFVARAAPDGHTLLFASDSTFTVNPHVYAKLPYDPSRDFAPIAQIVTFHQVLVAHPSLGVTSLADLVRKPGAPPGPITYASFGSGSSAHLLSELLRRETGVDLLHIPYKGIPQSVAAVQSGEAMLTWSGVFSTQAHIQAGRLVALGIAAPKRSSFLPGVPTLTELGYAAIDYTLWFGLFAPADTPRSLVDRIYRDVAAILADPEVRDKELLSKAYEPSALGPEAFAAHLRRELAQRAALVKMSGVRVE